MYQKQIEQLVVLQSVDDEIIGLREELEGAPRELAELENLLQSYDERTAQIDEKLDLLKQQQKRLDDEIEEDAGKVKKSKNKLMMASNTKEYHAMMREMDSLEKLNRMREEERVAVVEELARQKEAKVELDEEVGTVRVDFDAKKATLDERVQQAQKRLDALDKKRKKAGKVVPAPILGRYEFIRSRLRNPVIVPVTEGICSGCNIMIPPQIYNELQKGKQILSCPNCQRLIYWVEHTPVPSAED
ncbi:zinc ribbon domain-containing protein [Paucidesulfovibrio longus]|uniref:zinc ribbon domain-containing protein n=1 Tax=Paucidesulfovibrio longus TaxID=889 RepID=UPI0003B63291|nr:C4-type zinc ribbon domain-containing protein [Paucidesulfovibrio longus]